MQWRRWTHPPAAGNSPCTPQDICAQEWAGPGHRVPPGLRAHCSCTQGCSWEPGSSRGHKNHSQAPTGGSLPKHPIRGSCKLQPEFYFTSELLQGLTHPSLPLCDPWALRGSRQSHGVCGWHTQPAMALQPSRLEPQPGNTCTLLLMVVTVETERKLSPVFLSYFPINSSISPRNYIDL